MEMTYVRHIFTLDYEQNRVHYMSKQIAITRRQENVQPKYVKWTQHSWKTHISRGGRLRKDSVLDVRVHSKPTETFHFTSSHPPGV